jgi:hypothetical protein
MTRRPTRPGLSPEDGGVTSKLAEADERGATVPSVADDGEIVNPEGMFSVTTARRKGWLGRVGQGGADAEGALGECVDRHVAAAGQVERESWSGTSPGPAGRHARTNCRAGSPAASRRRGSPH